jgi:hypothetical protein
LIFGNFNYKLSCGVVLNIMTEFEGRPLERTVFPLEGRIPDESVPKGTRVQLVPLRKGTEQEEWRIRVVVKGERFGPWVSYQAIDAHGVPVKYLPYALGTKEGAQDICSIHGWVSGGEKK